MATEETLDAIAQLEVARVQLQVRLRVAHGDALARVLAAYLEQERQQPRCRIAALQRLGQGLFGRRVPCQRRELGAALEELSGAGGLLVAAGGGELRGRVGARIVRACAGQ